MTPDLSEDLAELPFADLPLLGARLLDIPERGLPRRMMYEKIIKSKPFWQWSLPHSMFFTSNIKTFV